MSGGAGPKNGARSALDMHAITVVRQMRKCSRACPAFILCPLMPLAVQPKDPAKRICLVNEGDDRLKAAYFKMFVGGQNGIVEMLQTNLLEYGEVLKKYGTNMTTKDRLRALEKFNSMLGQLHKMMGQASKPAGGGKKDEDDEMDEVVLIASQNEKPDPESLENSPMLEQLIRHEISPDAKYQGVPNEKLLPQEIDIAKELLDKYFPQEK